MRFRFNFPEVIKEALYEKYLLVQYGDLILVR
jgi:hypothetical protein